MEPLTIRIPEQLRESLDSEADEYGVSVSEYVRRLIEKGREYDDLQERLQAREARIDDLEEQLRRRSQIEDKIEDLQDLPDIVREQESYRDRRRRALDQASAVQRLKWRLTGVPADKVQPDETER